MMLQWLFLGHGITSDFHFPARKAGVGAGKGLPHRTVPLVGFSGCPGIAKTSEGVPLVEERTPWLRGHLVDSKKQTEGLRGERGGGLGWPRDGN